MRYGFMLSLALAMLLVAEVCAQDDTEKERARFARELEIMEGQLDAMKRKLAAGPETASEPELHPVRSKYDLKLYGSIKLDAAYDSGPIDPGNFALRVESEGTAGDDPQFSLTGNQSRFGLDVKAPSNGNAEVAAKIEVDFYGDGGETAPNPRLFLGYVEVKIPAYGLSILGGQAGDVIAPLWPNSLNYGVGLWAGNIGDLRPQLRVSKDVSLGTRSSAKFQIAAVRSVDGEEAGYPAFQGRVAFSFPLGGEETATVGFSGHVGEENDDARTWSTNLDLSLPICGWVSLKGEIWTGENLDAYLAGIGQGVNATTLEEIRSSGGWGALCFEPRARWQFNVGGGVDDPKDSDLSVGDRSKNTFVFGNALYDISEAMQIGFEVSSWDTEYKGEEDGESVRVQMSWIYSF